MISHISTERPRLKPVSETFSNESHFMFIQNLLLSLMVGHRDLMTRAERETTKLTGVEKKFWNPQTIQSGISVVLRYAILHLCIITARELWEKMTLQFFFHFEFFSSTPTTHLVEIQSGRLFRSKHRFQNVLELYFSIFCFLLKGFFDISL